MYCAEQLDSEFEEMHRLYLKVKVHKYNQNHLSKLSLIHELSTKFDFFRFFSYLFMLPMLAKYEGKKFASL